MFKFVFFVFASNAIIDIDSDTIW